MENLENVLEALLFVAGDAVSRADICFKYEIKEKELSEAVEKLKMKYNGKSGINLLEFNGKLQFSSNPDYVDYITSILNPIRERSLTKATMETIAIIAYKQPITRTEIEETRGVNCDYSINILLEHNLIEIVGHKDTVGKPALFGTTDEFLKRFDLSSLKELPDYNELLEKLQKIKETYSESLFNRFEPTLPNEDELDKKLEMVLKQDNNNEN